jgi:peptide/nickel transport system ATP-binding protein
VSSIEVRGLTVRYGRVTAVDRVDLAVPERGTLGLVGESGSGKSTIARAIVRLVPVASGDVLVGGGARPPGSRDRGLRPSVQMVFQDPYSSLNPRMTVGEAIEEPLRIHRRLGAAQRRHEVGSLLRLVALDPGAGERYPHEFSGGQRQRIAIARALAANPRVLIADEITSSLDVSVQANVLNLLHDLQTRLDLSYLFISHNLSVVRYMSDVVAVMYMGRIVEQAPTEEVFAHPQHPYTMALIDSVPQPGRRARPRLAGEIPDLRRPPTGCRFHTRCPIGPLHRPERTICIEADPQVGAAGRRHASACHFAGEIGPPR